MSARSRTTVDPAADESLLGGRYALLEVVGRGATADVHRARDVRLERDVAVKVGRPGAELPGGRSRIDAEAVLMAGLQHPHLVSVHDIGLADGRPYVVMDLVGGGTLAQLLLAQPGQRLPVEEVRVLGSAVAAALAAVHGAGIVHRDVKPANVLVGDAPDRRYLLTDFGIARLLEATRQTATGTTLGTAPYLAPEQVRGERVTPAADVYALGLVLLECLTGHVEYGGAAVEAAVARLHRRPHVPGDLPAAERQLLEQALDDDPSRRPTAAELAERLDAARSAPPPTAAGGADPAPDARAGTAAAVPRPRVRPVRPARRRATSVAAVALAATALLGGAAAAGTWSEPEPPAPLPAPAVPGETGRVLQQLHDAVDR